MAATVGLTIIKDFTYRGDANEEYSNQYWFTGSVPADSTAWKALADALIAEEVKVYSNGVKVIRAYGYNDDADGAVAVWGYDYEAAAVNLPGTFNPGSGALTPGDCAVWVRWKMDKLNSKGKPIYLRKYFHPAWATASTGTTVDDVLTAQKTALTAFGNKLFNGTFIDGRVIKAQKWSEPILSVAVSQYVTTRTLKRRGKRP